MKEQEKPNDLLILPVRETNQRQKWDQQRRMTKEGESVPLQVVAANVKGKTPQYPYFKNNFVMIDIWIESYL